MKKTFSMIVVTAVVLLVLSACMPAAGLTSETKDTLTVYGYGEARANPDMATVTVGVSISNAEISSAVQESNATIAEISAAMTELGIAPEDIQTTGFNVWPEDVWDPETGQPTGEKRYHVDSTMQINIRNVDGVGRALESALTHGANNIYGLSFGLQETAELAEQARRAAIEDANNRAQSMADALGLTLGEVSSASDQSGGTVYPYFVSAGMGLGGGGGEPPISQGQMAVNVTVNLTYQIDR